MRKGYRLNNEYLMLGRVQYYKSQKLESSEFMLEKSEYIPLVQTVAIEGSSESEKKGRLEAGASPRKCWTLP